MSPTKVFSYIIIFNKMRVTKGCFCVPLRVLYDICGLLCILSVIVGIIYTLVKKRQKEVLSVLTNLVPFAFWLASKCKPRNLNLKKLFVYTYLVFTMIPPPVISGFIFEVCILIKKLSTNYLHLEAKDNIPM